MRKRHVKPMSKRVPARACGGYMDGSLKGKIRYRKCVSGKISPGHQ